MKRKKLIKRILCAITLLLSIVTLFSVFTVKAHAEGGNTVYFKDAIIETNDSGLVVVEIVGEGNANDKLEVFVRSSGGTAIQGLDYVGLDQHLRLQYDKDGKLSYKLSIKCLNTAENREKLRIYDQNNELYGRYFNLDIYQTNNATVDPEKKVTKCFLPYNFKVEAVTGFMQDAPTWSNENHSYIKEYNVVQSVYNNGINDLDGRSTWRSWQHDMSFANDRSAMWVNTFINTGLASAYGTYMSKYIRDADPDWLPSNSNMKFYYGSKEMIDNWDRNEDVPGLSYYMSVEPQGNTYKWFKKHEYGFLMDALTTRYILVDDKNPYDKDDDLILVTEKKIKKETRLFSWYAENDTWYASKNSVVTVGAIKIDPYNGVLDTGIAAYNCREELDRKFKEIYSLLMLVDSTTPEIVGEFVDDSELKDTGKLKFIIRFSEPVVTTRGGRLTVYFNNSTTPYTADYVEGNYSDTLIYEMEPPKINIREVSYQLPNEDIGDMACNIDQYGIYQNNRLPSDITNTTRPIQFLNGAVNLMQPSLTIDKDSSLSAQNIYNLLVSINDNGQRDIKDGKLYYTWDKNEYLLDPADGTTIIEGDQLKDTKYYAEVHEFSPEENGSVTLTFTKTSKDAEGNEIGSGTYYLHALAYSGYGLAYAATYGPYVLDGDPPEINQINPTINELKTKEYAFVMKDKDTSTGIMNIFIQYKYVDAEGNTNEARTKLYENGEKVNGLQSVIKEETAEGSTTYSYRSTIVADAEVKDTVIADILAQNKATRMNFDVTFLVEDTAGNKKTSNIIKVVYDTRDLFNASIKFPEAQDDRKGYTKITDINVSYATYDKSTVGETDDEKLIYVTVDQSSRNLLAPGTKFSITMNGETIEANADDGVSVTISGLASGFYEIIPRITGEGVDLVSQNISFYITDKFNDITANKETTDTNLVLHNKVFQLQDQRYYFLDQSGSNVLSHPYGATYDATLNKSEGGSTNPSFSNVNEAKKYIKFMEYQDLYLIKITANIANLLNSGTASTSYVKASGETATAQEGQLWIRYKKDIWQSTATSFGWAFYYYGNGNVEDGININNLPANLRDALNAVVNRITSAGVTRYLVDEETLDQRTGAPYLYSGQIHVDREEATNSKAGTLFVTPAVYEGDKEIYKNKVKVGDLEYALATNMEIKVEDSTRLFYKYAAEGDWIELVLEEGKRLSQLFTTQASGFYKFREYGSGGISEYDIYYDKTTPLVDVEIGKEKQVLDGTILSYSGDSFVIKKITDIDDLAYIAIFSYPGRSLLNVLYASDLEIGESGQPNDYKLEENNYYLQVGDRSGNIVTYTILLSQTTLDVQVYENDSKTNIVVKVLDRTESEIYSYEVYVNETLVTTEFAETKVFKDPGVYRVVVRDIYGNEVNKTVEFASKTPEINWYYLNGEVYAKYDPDKVVKMVIYPDQNSSRVSNVYTSTMLRLTFVTSYGDDPIKFEMLDISASDYNYVDVSNTITINSLVGFRLRVWFEGTPENDHTYVVVIDNEAPTVSATFIGTSFAPYSEIDEDNNVVVSTASFDALKLDNYNEGDILTVDTLAYAIGSTSEAPFTDGAVIRGGHIVLSFNDPSKIGNYTVAINGQQVVVEPNEDGQLIVNNYGEYVITVTDLLGNVRRFSFVNTNDPVATATIDGNVLKDSTETFGADEAVLKALYPGEARLLLKTATDTRTYIFNFDGSVLTYGYYVCVVERQQNESGEIVDVKTAQYQENPDFKFDITADNIIQNAWYDVLKEEDFTISVAVVDGKPLIKVTSNEKELDLEMSYNAGKTIFPSYFIASLSKEAPFITILRGDEEKEPVEIKEGSKYIYVSETITIDPNVNGNITNIEVGFSNSPTITDLESIYSNGEFTEYFTGTEDGFYRIVVSNKYNNQTEYMVVKVDSFLAVINATYRDGSTREFLNSKNTIYANGVIALNIYSEGVEFEVKEKNDEEAIRTEGIYQNGVTTLEIYKQGEYVVSVTGGNGVTEDYKLVIATDPDFIFNEDWLTGYNEKALLRSQGYTNLPLTPITSDDVKEISYKYGENDLVVLYDVISEDMLDDESALTNSIGRDGDGDYIIYYTNIYGDSVNKVIHFRSTALLELSRKTLSSQTTYENYPLEKAIVNDFYSNYVLKFDTKSTKYVFTINGVSYPLEDSKTLEFSNTSGNGSFGYDITYLDEYGNYVEFRAELYRTDIVIDSSQMKEIIVNNNTYTKDDIIITFDDNLTGTVSVDDGAKKSYESGTKFYKDGKYEFIVEDIAGNRNTYVINHKSINHYTLTNAVNNQPIIIGGVINDASVVFAASDDSRITSVFKNGQKVDNYNSNTFRTTGHWEIIVEDNVGNQAYSSFYIINNELVSFDYTAPYDYEITEVWLVKSKDNRELQDMGGSKISLTQPGDYAVVVSNSKSNTTFNFTVTINTTLPTATLDGAEDGGITSRNVTIKGLRSGDVVEIYKDGTLVSATEVNSANSVPEIATGGTYKIIIRSVSGAQVEYSFTRKQVANAATSIFIIIACLAAVAGITIGLLYHTKLKNDSEK